MTTRTGMSYAQSAALSATRRRADRYDNDADSMLTTLERPPSAVSITDGRYASSRPSSPSSMMFGSIASEQIDVSTLPRRRRRTSDPGVSRSIDVIDTDNSVIVDISNIHDDESGADAHSNVSDPLSSDDNEPDVQRLWSPVKHIDTHSSDRRLAAELQRRYEYEIEMLNKQLREKEHELSLAVGKRRSSTVADRGLSVNDLKSPSVDKKPVPSTKKKRNEQSKKKGKKKAKDSRSQKPERASSQLPKRSFIYRAMHSKKSSHDDDSSSSSSDTSSSESDYSGSQSDLSDNSSSDSLSSEPSEIDSSDSEHTRKRKKAAKKKYKYRINRRKLEQAAAKTVLPFKYNGEPHADVYQRWIISCRRYLHSCYVRRKNRVERLEPFVTGNAAKFYSIRVGLAPRKWTLRRFFEALFDHCFPPNFRSLQREKFDQCRQAGREVREYVRELQDLQVSIGDVRHRSLILQFWKGSDLYIRVKWAEAGYSPEIASFKELQTAAERYELAEEIKTAERDHADHHAKHAIKHSLNNVETQDEVQSSENSLSDGENPGVDHLEPIVSEKQTQRSVLHPAKRDSKDRENIQTTPSPKLSPSERERLLRQGRFFLCKETGHMIKDCPKHEADGSSTYIRSNAAAFEPDYEDSDEGADLMTARKGIGFFMIHLASPGLVPDHPRAVETESPCATETNESDLQCLEMMLAESQLHEESMAVDTNSSDDVHTTETRETEKE